MKTREIDASTVLLPSGFFKVTEGRVERGDIILNLRHLERGDVTFTEIQNHDIGSLFDKFVILARRYVKVIIPLRYSGMGIGFMLMDLFKDDPSVRILPGAWNEPMTIVDIKPNDALALLDLLKKEGVMAVMDTSRRHNPFGY